jgi:hypothetical protein
MIYRDIERQPHLYVKETNCFYFQCMYEGVTGKLYYIEATQVGKLPKKDFNVSVQGSIPPFLYRRLKDFFETMPDMRQLSFDGFCPNCEMHAPGKEIRATGTKLNYCFLCGKKLEGGI